MHRQRLFSALMQDAQDQNPGVEQYPLNDKFSRTHVTAIQRKRP
jgi:hypothetical protein